MTEAELRDELQSTNENRLQKTNAEIALVFPMEDPYVRERFVADFDILTPWTRELGWDVKSIDPIDQTLQTMPDILFFR